MTETIACLTAQHVDSLALAEGFTALEPQQFEDLLLGDALWLGPRALLETNEGFRQLVSYVVFRHAHTVLAYRRTPKGGETRLHGRLSVGVGGHVNVSDVTSDDGVVDLNGTLRRACAREIAEEVACGSFRTLETVGIIKESVNAVSRVHLGVVVECWLNTPEVQPIDPGLVDVQFLPIPKLATLTNEMETWSAALVPYLQSGG